MKHAPIYRLNERIWHWLQGLTIIVLLVTGAEIHAPDSLTILGFGTAVIVHNVFAFLLLLNAILGLLYFAASGMIRHYVPEQQDFFILAAKQTMFYLRGIFRGEKHPIEHDERNRLNPLQKITYLMILNILLPVQIVTGILIWISMRWPGLLESWAGLPIVIPIHALAAWLFLSFTVMHIYLTTTGHTPLANMRSMIGGGKARAADVTEKAE